MKRQRRTARTRAMQTARRATARVFYRRGVLMWGTGHVLLINQTLVRNNGIYEVVAPWSPHAS